ncbi:MAG: hypothetical protein KF898_05190 [Parachlamydiales bacterium]|nr:hypothetical protein [Verrucomicrobiota bacterium]MBX3719023.1 hypothetical protein [Candidatus Acheromyda pituitae]
MTTQVVGSLPHVSSGFLITDPQDSALLQQVIVSEALTGRMAQDSSESFLARFSPVFVMSQYYADQFAVIRDIAQETILHLQSCYAAMSDTPPDSERLLEFRANIDFLQAVIDIEETIPRSFKAMFPDGKTKELISDDLKEKIQYVHGSCKYNLDLYTRIFEQKADAMLKELGWDLGLNKAEARMVEKWTHKMIVPLSLSDARQISMSYPWKNYIIDNRLVPADTRILDLISRLPSSVEIPENYQCPVSAQVMAFPTRTPCGHVYDRHIILSSLREKKECPLDRGAVKASELVPVDDLRGEIHEWLKRQYVTVTVHAELSETDFLTIRGNEAGLSWDKGIPLKRISSETWAIEIPFVQGCKYKVLINDSTSCWETGNNHTISERKAQEITPIFPVPVQVSQLDRFL